MNEMIGNLGRRMSALARVCNISKREWSKDERRFTEVRPRTRFDHEFHGMEMAIEAMGIEFNIEYSGETLEMTAIIIMGKRFDI